MVTAELKLACLECYVDAKKIKPMGIIMAVRQSIKNLAAKVMLEKLGKILILDFAEVFELIPNVDWLPMDVYHSIELKDSTQKITSRLYSTLWKYHKVWKTLIEQHVKSSPLQPSNSVHASPAFLAPKTNPSDLLCWVNDYHVPNANTILDTFPLPQVNDILADCPQATVWSKMDMTNSFFQTLMKPDDMWKTAVTTPFGLHEWIVMPMGLCNLPPIHQHCVTAALWHLIGKICHVYIDDIMIWSNSMEDLTRDIQLVLQTLCDASLYLNPKKC